ncbi:hypothetical protein HN615_15955 [Candidatus Woesearchaeota archaeon]|jgi:hypothetical protein|nr:hypothetical protein [Candidatus Woesearchaeota archaeon]
MISQVEYIKAFESYKNLVLQDDFVLGLLQSGSVKNPGISDIDTILVIDTWNDFIPSIQLLNPERVSSLFTHGPFVCKKSSLDKLSVFTTLQFYNSGKLRSSLYAKNQVSQLVVTLIRQSGCFLHFNSIKNNLSSVSHRQMLLVTKSLVHSFSDLKEAGLIKNKTKYLFLISMLDKNISIALNANIQKIDTRALSDCFVEYVEYGVVLVSSLLEQQLCKYNIKYSERSELDLLNWFQKEIDSGEWCAKKNLFDSTIVEWRKFYNEMSEGYSKNGVLWKGAEFVFMNFKPYSSIHLKLFLRRVIKHSNILFKFWRMLKING